MRTDFTPLSVLRKRALTAIQRKDKYVGSEKEFEVPFHSDFDRFAAEVAYALRHKIVYRSDGGRFARGLVRASSDLEGLHTLLKGDEPPPAEGSPVTLTAHFFRRRDRLAENRWVMSIRFNTEVDFEGEVVEGSSPEKLFDTVVDCAILFAREIAGEPGKRIAAMVDIADDLRYPKNKELWYYNRAAVKEYMDWRTDEKRRDAMTSGTRGRLPFDGYVWPHGQWRIYPFKSMLRKHGVTSQGGCDKGIKAELVFMDSQIFQSIDDINKLLSSTSLAGGTLLKGRPEAFLDHLRGLQHSKESLYSAFR